MNGEIAKSSINEHTVKVKSLAKRKIKLKVLELAKSNEFEITN